MAASLFAALQFCSAPGALNGTLGFQARFTRQQRWQSAAQHPVYPPPPCRPLCYCPSVQPANQYRCALQAGVISQQLASQSQQRRKLHLWQLLGKQKTLTEIAFILLQQGLLLGRFHTFGHQLDAQLVAYG